MPRGVRSDCRLRELLLHAPFNEFLTQELVPWARENYHISSDPSKTIVGGSSAGGLAAALSTAADQSKQPFPPVSTRPFGILPENATMCQSTN